MKNITIKDIDKDTHEIMKNMPGLRAIILDNIIFSLDEIERTIEANAPSTEERSINFVKNLKKIVEIVKPEKEFMLIV